MNNGIKTVDKLDDRLARMEQMKMQESQRIVENFIDEIMKHRQQDGSKRSESGESSDK